MKSYAYLLAPLVLTACAATDQQERISAVEDLIVVSELEETNAIRTRDQLNQDVINDRYVIVSTRNERELYLIEYYVACREDPVTGRVMADVRRDKNAIYAGSDTFRGCQIKAIYPIDKDLAEELKNVGEAPGE